MRRLALVVVLGVAAFAAAITKPSVPESVAPVRKVSIGKTFAYVRVPPGKGPFPAIVFYHGTLDQWPPQQLKAAIESGQTLSRFLAARYVVAAAEFATRIHDPQNPDTLRDCLDVLKWVQQMPQVDPASVAIYGISGGG